MKKYVVVEKAVGQTPLQAIEEYRHESGLNPDIPLAYAGRLDPMASGKLLTLIGEECKHQEKYHSLDKGYTFSVLFGVGSDTQDILGRLSFTKPINPDKTELIDIIRQLVGSISLPYPHFSSKTVAGKPLHVWTLENRLDEIEIPMSHSQIYKLRLIGTISKKTEDIYREVINKIESLPTVTEKSKVLGADFRRVDVRGDWQLWREMFPKQEWTIATFECAASSGTYMRSLSELIGERLGVPSLAYSIHRTHVGRYQKLPFLGGWWRTEYR